MSFLRRRDRSSGAFTAADAMHAPVASRDKILVLVAFRFQKHKASINDPVAKAYMDALLADSDVRAWEDAALAERPPLQKD